ncbi:hypothetical protein BLA60_21540 [Actinophytocola xinjiangensis]|uniref:Uncharacterized protein n=1 Tax=Actinophytocola xinjiangensis TaxID=485602 RepID=A0A7Z0WL61_9PSEU|nr:hypothetical protein [Actinophytocola xinjiangensis]OLF09157.1 hypothetical protein BLA60_21540 [Actinophytocola xinjiangensis]
MTRPLPAITAVEQAWLRLGEDGVVSTVASSFTDENAERGWVDAVGPHLGFPDASLRGPALSYLVLPDGLAAVLYRLREPGGVPIAHALLGRADQLTPAVALSTVDWQGWLADGSPGARLTRLRVEDLGSPATAQRLRQQAVRQGDLLAQVLAWVLQAPTAPVGIVGCSEADRPALTLALVRIAEPVLPARPWSFVLQPDSATDGTNPTIAFFDAEPDDPAGRLIIDVRRDRGASPQNEYRANALVYRYEFGVDPPNAAAAPAILPVPPPAPPPLRPAPPQQTHHAPAVLPQWRVSALVRDLADARDATAVNGALVELEYAVAAIDERDNVRRALAGERWAQRAILRHVPFDQLEPVHVRLAQIAFGATGPGRVTPGAREDARRLVAGAESTVLVRAVARVVADGELAMVLAKRWLRETEPVEPDPTAELGPLARVFWRMGLPVTPLAARITFGLFVLAAGIGLGWWIGGVPR